MMDMQSFATEWIAAWNARDLETILSHYDESVVFLSPVAQRVTGNGRVEGIETLRRYWTTALGQIPDLRFTLEEALVGHRCLTVLYRNQRGQRVAEVMEFGADGKVVRSCGCYGEAA